MKIMRMHDWLKLIGSVSVAIRIYKIIREKLDNMLYGIPCLSKAIIQSTMEGRRRKLCLL
jgi:hypothetical protein